MVTITGCHSWGGWCFFRPSVVSSRRSNNKGGWGCCSLEHHPILLMTVLRMMDEIEELLRMIQKQFGISAVAIKVEDKVTLHEGEFQQRRKGVIDEKKDV